jgi:hypothetical protein
LLDGLIARSAENDRETAATEKRWWDAMREESEGDA